MAGPSGTSFAPSTSKNKRTPFTDTCIAKPLACFGADTKPYRVKPVPDSDHQSQFWRTPPLNVRCFLMSGRPSRQGKMSLRLQRLTCAAAVVALIALASQAFAQSDDSDPELRIQKLEEQLRQLTGQNEELQFRNRQLEDRLRQLGAAPGGPPQAVQPQVAQPQAAQPGMAA